MLVLSVAAFLLEVARVGPAYHCVKLGISTVRCDADAALRVPGPITPVCFAHRQQCKVLQYCGDGCTIPSAHVSSTAEATIPHESPFPKTIIPPKAQPCGRPAGSLEEGFPSPRHVEVDSLSSDVSMSSKATSGRMPTPLSGGSNINREVVAMQNMDCQNAVVF